MDEFLEKHNLIKLEDFKSLRPSLQIDYLNHVQQDQRQGFCQNCKDKDTCSLGILYVRQLQNVISKHKE